MTITVTEAERTSRNKFLVKVVSGETLGPGSILKSDYISMIVLEKKDGRFHVKTIITDSPTAEVENPIGKYTIVRTVTPVQLGVLENVKISDDNATISGIFHPSKLYRLPSTLVGTKLIAYLPKQRLMVYKEPEAEIRELNVIGEKKGEKGNSGWLQLSIQNPARAFIDPESFFYIYGFAEKITRVFKRGEIVRKSVKVGYFVDPDEYQAVNIAGEGTMLLPRNKKEEPTEQEWNEVEFDELEEEPEEEEQEKEEARPEEASQGVPEEFVSVARFECNKIEGFLVEGSLFYDGNVNAFRNALMFLEKVEDGKTSLLQIVFSKSISKRTKGKVINSSAKSYRFVVRKIKGDIELGTYNYSRGVIPTTETVLDIAKLPRAPEGLQSVVYGTKITPVLVLKKGPVHFDKPRVLREGFKETFTTSIYGFLEPARLGNSKLTGELIPPRHPLAIEGEVFMSHSSTPKKSLFETGIDIQETKLLAEKMVRDWERSREGLYDIKDLARGLGKQKGIMSETDRQKMAEELATRLSLDIIDTKKRFIKDKNPVIAKRIEEQRVSLFKLFCCASFLANTYLDKKDTRYANIKGLTKFVHKEPEWNQIQPFCSNLTEEKAYDLLRKKIPELNIHVKTESRNENNSVILASIENAFFDQLASWEENGVRRTGKVIRHIGPSVIVKDRESGVERVLLAQKEKTKNLMYYPDVGENVIIDLGTENEARGTFIGFAKSLNYMFIKVRDTIMAYPSSYENFEWAGSLQKEAEDNYGNLEGVERSLVSYFVKAFTDHYGVTEKEVTNDDYTKVVISMLPQIQKGLSLESLETDIKSILGKLPKSVQAHLKDTHKQRLTALKNVAPAKAKELNLRSMKDLQKIISIPKEEKERDKAMEIVEIVNNAIIENEYIDYDKSRALDVSVLAVKGLIHKMVSRFDTTLLQKVREFVSEKPSIRHLEHTLSKLPKNASLSDIAKALSNTLERGAEKSLIEKVREFVSFWKNQPNMSSKELLHLSSTAGALISGLFAKYETYFKKKIQTGEYPIENVPYFTPAHFLPEFFATKYLDDDYALTAMMTLINDARNKFINDIRTNLVKSVYEIKLTSPHQDDLEMGMRLASYAREWFRSVDMQCFDTNPEFTETDPSNIVMCKEKDSIVCYSVPKLIESIYGDGRNPNDPSKKLSPEFIHRMKKRYPQNWLNRLPPSPSGILIQGKDAVKSYDVEDVVKAIYAEDIESKQTVTGMRGSNVRVVETIKKGIPKSDLRKDIDFVDAQARVDRERRLASLPSKERTTKKLDELNLLERLRRKYPKSLIKPIEETAKTETGFEFRSSCLSKNEDPYAVKGFHFVDLAGNEIMHSETFRFNVRKGYREIKVGKSSEFDKVLVILDNALNHLQDAPKEVNQIVYIGTKFKSFEEFIEKAQEKMTYTFENGRYHFYSGKPSHQIYERIIKDLLWCIEGTKVLDEPDPKFSTGYKKADEWVPRFLELSRVKSHVTLREQELEEDIPKKKNKAIPEPVFEPSESEENSED